MTGIKKPPRHCGGNNKGNQHIACYLPRNAARAGRQQYRWITNDYEPTLTLFDSASDYCVGSSKRTCQRAFNKIFDELQRQYIILRKI